MRLIRPLLGAFPLLLVAGGMTAVSAANAGAASESPGLAAASRQVEKLNRGVVSVRSGNGNLVSWRWLGTDPDAVAFNVYRGATKLTAAPITGSTNYLDSGAAAGSVYTVRAVVNGAEQPASEAALQFGSGYLDVPIQSPGGNYAANDASVGDLDGDGQYEIVLKWNPSDAKDNSQSGVTSNVYVDAYRLNGSRLWRINLGRNIRAGAHYTQFQVYDYDGDGRAEVAMKTADGSTDGAGRVIGNAGADYRNSAGYVLAGPEFLTMFNGQTGAAMSTVNYDPPRGTVSSWGDNYGNRVDRFLAGTAYLDGQRPSLIMARGYYTRTVIAAWDFRNGALHQALGLRQQRLGQQRLRRAGQPQPRRGGRRRRRPGRDRLRRHDRRRQRQGAVEHRPRPRRRGPRRRSGPVPRRPGVLQGLRELAQARILVRRRPDRTGPLEHSGRAGDNGRGVAADIWAGSPGAESWSARVAGLANTKGQNVGRKPSSINFLAWWDGDPVRELLDGTRIDKYGTGGETRLLTGQQRALQQRHQVHPGALRRPAGRLARGGHLAPPRDNTALRIYSTPNQTDRRITTLMHDTQYRAAIAWQNTAYNQPPHPSFFIGNGMANPPRPAVYTAN